VGFEEKTFYVFASEVENVDENKLKVAGDSYSVHILVANKCDKVSVHFYNVDDVKTERHSFTIGDPYKVDILTLVSVRMETRHLQLTKVGYLPITADIICQ
jgi:hypothetical protein